MVETVKEDPKVAGMRIQMVEEILKMERENAKQAEKSAKLKEELARIKSTGEPVQHT